MLDLLTTVLTGGATGIIGSLLGKAFSFLDFWVEEKKADGEHARTLELLDLQNKIGAEESERELAIAEATTAGNLRMASYDHDSSMGARSTWVVDILSLVRPVLTVMLIVLVALIYFNTADAGDRATIVASVIFLCSSAVTWWFGDRTMRKK
tara:strand:+ start:41 stop:496 length:456 start_codon:yes stop_codon:yes gene_type:complete